MTSNIQLLPLRGKVLARLIIDCSPQNNRLCYLQKKYSGLKLLCFTPRQPLHRRDDTTKKERREVGKQAICTLTMQTRTRTLTGSLEGRPWKSPREGSPPVTVVSSMSGGSGILQIRMEPCRRAGLYNSGLTTFWHVYKSIHCLIYKNSCFS